MLCRALVAAVAAASVAVVIAPDGASARFGGGGHGFGFHHAIGPFHARARFPFLRRRGAPSWYLPYGDSFGDGGYDLGAAVPNDGGPVTVPRTVVVAPPCRVQLETRTVPAERGGSRSVTVTKCALAPPGQTGAYNAVAERADDVPLTTGGLGEDKPIDAQGCRADVRAVPAEGGGERRVTITRC